MRELGFHILPSSANFIFTRHRSAPSGELTHALPDGAVLILHFNAPRIENYLRIAIGMAE